MKIVLISYTPKDAPGGVPRWNRDFMSGIPAEHYSWWDFLKAQGMSDQGIPEWDKAQVLGFWLGITKRVGKDTVVIADGFWASGVENFVPREQIVSVCHGNWSHTTKEDVDKGIPPEFPDHHRAQLAFRRRHRAAGGKLVAVSDFIAHQCEIQWGLDMPVINNGVDLEEYHPVRLMPNWSDKMLIVHGTTNANKGFDHIEAVKRAFPEDRVMLLDEVAEFLELPKYEALANADLVLHPSGHEGNSYFVLEALACDRPIVSYDVGLMYQARKERAKIGVIGNREHRSPAETVALVREARFKMNRDPDMSGAHCFPTHDSDCSLNWHPREWVSRFSLGQFQQRWREYLFEEFGC